jgi:hypothetical protein
MERPGSRRSGDGVVIGSVVALWRYPVKSMAGEELDEAVVTERGVLGDRAYALLDRAEGKIASAKHPRKWGQLLELRASYAWPPARGGALPPVRIALPDGATIASSDDGVDEVLSQVTGRRVTLTATAAGTGTLEEYWPAIDGLAPRESPTGRRPTDSRSIRIVVPGLRPQREDAVTGGGDDAVVTVTGGCGRQGGHGPGPGVLSQDGVLGRRSAQTGWFVGASCNN